MRFLVAIILSLLFSSALWGQSYQARLEKYQTDYVQNHEVVPDSNRKYLGFFPIDKSYCVKATFTKANGSDWFNLPTSSGKTKAYRTYGSVRFKIHGKPLVLYMYQARALLEKSENWDYLFLPFADATNGEISYEGGRYLDLKISDIKNQQVEIDFNKAYNPYCAYVEGKYSCPIPPRENQLAVAIQAGEKKYSKPESTQEPPVHKQ